MLSRSAQSPRLKELYRRAAQDQFVRSQSQVSATLPPLARQYLSNITGARACRADADNSPWILQDVRSNGWYRVSQFGADADTAAFLLVQHADRMPEIQMEILPILEALLPSKDTQGQSYALLYDRVAVGEGRAQRYGTQGRCTAPNVWTPMETEDAESLEARRQAVGFPISYADYTAGLNRVCANRAPPILPPGFRVVSPAPTTSGSAAGAGRPAGE